MKKHFGILLLIFGFLSSAPASAALQVARAAFRKHVHPGQLSTVMVGADALAAAVAR
jgi:hypothetical protein